MNDKNFTNSGDFHYIFYASILSKKLNDFRVIIEFSKLANNINIG